MNGSSATFEYGYSTKLAVEHYAIFIDLLARYLCSTCAVYSKTHHLIVVGSKVALIDFCSLNWVQFHLLQNTQSSSSARAS